MLDFGQTLVYRRYTESHRKRNSFQSWRQRHARTKTFTHTHTDAEVDKDYGETYCKPGHRKSVKCRQDE